MKREDRKDSDLCMMYGSDGGENVCGGPALCAHTAALWAVFWWESPLSCLTRARLQNSPTRGGQDGVSVSSPDGFPLGVFCVSIRRHEPLLRVERCLY